MRRYARIRTAHSETATWDKCRGVLFGACESLRREGFSDLKRVLYVRCSAANRFDVLPVARSEEREWQVTAWIGLGVS
jgi:hypothetical protein